MIILLDFVFGLDRCFVFISRRAPSLVSLIWRASHRKKDGLTHPLRTVMISRRKGASSMLSLVGMPIGVGHGVDLGNLADDRSDLPASATGRMRVSSTGGPAR
jgi:hypothetical protein